MTDLTLDLDLVAIPTTRDVCDELPNKTSKLGGIKSLCETCVNLMDNGSYTPTNKATDAYPGLFHWKDGTKTEKVSINSSSKLTGEHAVKLCMMDLQRGM